MIEREDLEKAVRAGVITAQQADAIAALEQEGKSDVMRAGDPESFGFLKGFNDVFLTVGVVFVIVAFTFLPFDSLWRFLVMAGVSWALSEVLVRQTRAVLPMIAAAIGFIGAGAALAALLYPRPDNVFGLTMFIAAAGAALAAFVYYARFKLPFALAPLACAATFALSLESGKHFGDYGHAAQIAVQLVCGLAIFALAMRLDRRDPERRTPDADKAFWLHVAAAPPIVNALAGPLIQDGGQSVAASVAVVAVVALLGLVALIVDRRALLVSSLFYFVAALVYLAKTSGAEGQMFTVPLGIAGLAVLALGIGWHGFRAALLRRLPNAFDVRNLPQARS